MKIFVGWDSREDIAYQVCKHSILKRTDADIEIEPLKQEELTAKGLYTRRLDPLSSTEFTFTRFLVPYLMGYNGWAMFVDCDFLFVDDVVKLFRHAQERENCALLVVQHDYKPSSTTKMDNQVQHQYPRKNWSSLIMYNCGHPEMRKLTPDVVNSSTGAFLHRFSWLNDKFIGTIPHQWNWLVNWYKEPHHGKPSAIHYTEGGPWFPNYISCEYGGNWIEEKHEYLSTVKHPIVLNPLEHIPFEVKTHMHNILKYRTDPDGDIHNITYDTLVEDLKIMNSRKVVGIESELDDSKLEKKGQISDPIINSFVLGCGGQTTTWEKTQNSMIPVVLRGITKRKQMAFCKEKGRDFYFVDTGYFGNGRKKSFHRITKNDMQYLGPIKDRPTDRLAMTGWRFKKFSPGKNILLCPPSAKAMVTFGLDLAEWIKETVNTIKKYTDRPIIIREKQSRTVRTTIDTMEMALSKDVHCMVTFNSIAAVESIIYGKPAFTLGPNAAQHICHKDLSLIEKPFIPTQDEVHRFVSHLAYCQFTEAEMRDGTAWRILNEE
jgi:lipopolysaccharide biosynthesis glycosyltransferase